MMMENLVLNFIGPFGTFLVLAAYFLLQRGTWEADGKKYLFTNIVGSAILISTNYYDWNLSYFTINICWLAISIYGLYSSSKINK